MEAISVHEVPPVAEYLTFKTGKAGKVKLSVTCQLMVMDPTGMLSPERGEVMDIVGAAVSMGRRAYSGPIPSPTPLLPVKVTAAGAFKDNTSTTNDNAMIDFLNIKILLLLRRPHFLPGLPVFEGRYFRLELFDPPHSLMNHTHLIGIAAGPIKCAGCKAACYCRGVISIYKKPYYLQFAFRIRRPDPHPHVALDGQIIGRA